MAHRTRGLRRSPTGLRRHRGEYSDGQGVIGRKRRRSELQNQHVIKSARTLLLWSTWLSCAMSYLFIRHRMAQSSLPHAQVSWHRCRCRPTRWSSKDRRAKHGGANRFRSNDVERKPSPTRAGRATNLRRYAGPSISSRGGRARGTVTRSWYGLRTGVCMYIPTLPLAHETRLDWCVL